MPCIWAILVHILTIKTEMEKFENILDNKLTKNE